MAGLQKILVLIQGGFEMCKPVFNTWNSLMWLNDKKARPVYSLALVLLKNVIRTVNNINSKALVCNFTVL